MILTVFTATFNRKNLLQPLYESLLRQKCTDFEWLVVDDGSTDGTSAFIEKCIQENKITIHYFYKENGGKHTAINYGVSQAVGKLFFLVDSDDTITDDSLQIICNEWDAIENDAAINGLVGLFQDSNKNIFGDSFDSTMVALPFADIYYKYHLKGDKAVVFKTAILKDYPFPESPGIRFVFEAVVWHDMSKKYKTRCVNHPIAIVSYQANGLSDSNYKLWYIEGLAFSYYNLVLKNVHPFFTYPKVFIQNYIYLALNSMLSHKNYFAELKLHQKLLYILVTPRALWAYFKMKKLIVS